MHWCIVPLFLLISPVYGILDGNYFRTENNTLTVCGAGEFSEIFSGSTCMNVTVDFRRYFTADLVPCPPANGTGWSGLKFMPQGKESDIETSQYFSGFQVNMTQVRVWDEKNEKFGMGISLSARLLPDIARCNMTYFCESGACTTKTLGSSALTAHSFSLLTFLVIALIHFL